MAVRMVRHDGADWNALIEYLPGAHILQTRQWAEFKQRSTGWTPAYYLWRDEQATVRAACMVLRRQIGPAAILYAPRGPLLDHTDGALLKQVLADLEKLARRAITLKIDPDIVLATGEPGSADDTSRAEGAAAANLLKKRRWRFSGEQVQFRNTVIVDLRPTEDELLAAMGGGKRRKVRYGPKHGVTVRAGTLADLPLLYRLYAETSARNKFLIRPESYYLDEWGTILRAGLGHALIAEVDGSAVAHVVLFRFGAKCLYFTGASVDDPEMRRLMPADLLQWEAMRWAKAQGCTQYDFWGAPDEFNENDPLWGVYEFKRDFGGQVVRHIGAWDYTTYPPLYALYTRGLPALRRLLSGLRPARR